MSEPADLVEAVRALLEQQRELAARLGAVEVALDRLYRRAVAPGPQEPLALGARGRRCSICRGRGHDRRTCPLAAEAGA